MLSDFRVLSATRKVKLCLSLSVSLLEVVFCECLCCVCSTQIHKSIVWSVRCHPCRHIDSVTMVTCIYLSVLVAVDTPTAPSYHGLNVLCGIRSLWFIAWTRGSPVDVGCSHPGSISPKLQLPKHMQMLWRAAELIRYPIFECQPIHVSGDIDHSTFGCFVPSASGSICPKTPLGQRLTIT